MTDLDIEWVDELPAPSSGPQSAATLRREAVVDALRSEPGRWCRVEHHTSSPIVDPYRLRDCETSYRKVRDDDGTFLGFDTYARWPQEDT